MRPGELTKCISVSAANCTFRVSGFALLLPYLRMDLRGAELAIGGGELAMCTSSSSFTLARFAGLSIRAESMSDSISEPNARSGAWVFVRFREPRLRPCSFSTDCSSISMVSSLSSSSRVSSGVCGAVGSKWLAETDAAVSLRDLRLSLSFGCCGSSARAGWSFRGLGLMTLGRFGGMVAVRC